MKKEEITAVIMAGGLGKRMGMRDKGLLLLQGIPLFKHVAMRLQHQVVDIIINANRNYDEYQQSGYRVVRDRTPGFLGPLAAIETGLSLCSTEWCLFVTCDTPFLPLDLAARLYKEKANRDAVYVYDGIRSHPLLLLLHQRVLPRASLQLQQRQLKVRAFLEDVDSYPVVWTENPQLFSNINTPDDLEYWNTQLEHKKDK